MDLTYIGPQFTQLGSKTLYICICNEFDSKKLYCFQQKNVMILISPLLLHFLNLKKKQLNFVKKLGGFFPGIEENVQLYIPEKRWLSDIQFNYILICIGLVHIEWINTDSIVCSEVRVYIKQEWHVQAIWTWNGNHSSIRNGILLPKLFWPTVRKNCSSDREKVLKFEAEGREFAKILRSLEQFIQTVQGQNNFW